MDDLNFIAGTQFALCVAMARDDVAIARNHKWMVRIETPQQSLQRTGRRKRLGLAVYRDRHAHTFSRAVEAVSRRQGQRTAALSRWGSDSLTSASSTTAGESRNPWR